MVKEQPHQQHAQLRSLPLHVKDVYEVVVAACSQLAAVWRVLQVIDGLLGEVHLQQPPTNCNSVSCCH